MANEVTHAERVQQVMNEIKDWDQADFIAFVANLMDEHSVEVVDAVHQTVFNYAVVF